MKLITRSPGAERVTYLSSGQPLEFVHSLARADPYQIWLHLANTEAMPFNLEK